MLISLSRRTWRTKPKFSRPWKACPTGGKWDRTECAELSPGEVSKYLVVRVADEIVVDLMAKASGIDYAEASKSVVIHELDGVSIPFASPELLWRMKIHTHRAKDAPDLFFLRKWFEAEGRTPPE